MGATEKNIPDLRFPEFEGEWGENRIDSTFNILNGFAFSSNDAQNSGALWVKIADVGIQNMKNGNVSYLPIDYLEIHNKFVLHKGDYVVALTRPILGGELKIAQIDDFFHNSLLNQRVGKIQSNHSLDFVYFLLQRKRLVKSIENRIAGSDPPNLSPNEIKSLRVYVAKRVEQKKIADFIKAVGEKIGQLVKKKELLKQYKKGVMQKLFSGSLRFTDDNGNAYPDWEEKKLGDYILEHKGGAALKPSDFVPKSSYEVIPKKAIQAGGELILDKVSPTYCREAFFEHNTKSVIDRSYLVTTLRDLVPSGPSIGFIVKITLDKIYILAQGVYGIKIDLRLLCGDFLVQFSNTDAYRKVMKTILVGSTQVHIRNKDFFNVTIFTPKLAEQQKIAGFLSSIDQKIDQVTKQLDQVKIFKKGLLQQMFV